MAQHERRPRPPAQSRGHPPHLEAPMKARKKKNRAPSAAPKRNSGAARGARHLSDAYRAGRAALKAAAARDGSVNKSPSMADRREWGGATWRDFARGWKDEQSAKVNPRRRRNQDDDPELEAAARLSEKFHGRPARQVRTVETMEETPSTLADLGGLRELHVQTHRGGRLFEFRKDVRLASTPDGRQLYIVGGDQELDLAGLSIPERANAEIGEVARIVYYTRKGFHNFEPTLYVHEFGEDRGGRRPTLGYDAINHQLFFLGGTYSVRPEGIVN
jgi:hypothetical protein